MAPSVPDLRPVGPELGLPHLGHSSAAGAGLPVSPDGRERRESSSASPPALACSAPRAVRRDVACRTSPSRPGQADPRQQARAGGHHPAPASYRVPQERDPPAALVGSRSRQAGPRRRQDRPQDRSPQHSGPARSRTPAVRRKPLRLSVAERSRPAPQPQPRVLRPP